MKLLIGDENHSLPLYAYVAGFGISGYICNLIWLASFISYIMMTYIITYNYYTYTYIVTYS